MNDLQNWQPSDFICPECGGEAEIGDWWDDPPELGGACIGILRRCVEDNPSSRCDWFESY